LFLETSVQLCEGEILEIREQNNFDLSEALYFEIIEKKTASLLATCVESGAISAGLPIEEVSALKQFGLSFGMAFQIVDDCLDFEGDKAELGKEAGTDLNAGVLTLPLIRLISLVSEKQKSEVFKVFKSGSSQEKFKYLSRLVQEYETVSYSISKAKEWVDRAKLELSVLRHSEVRSSFEQLLDFVVSRRF
jgi:octaprenyl-diphosphate synthase